MRFQAVIGCLAIGLLPQLGLAAEPPGEVGALQAVYDFCAKVDPSEAKNFEKRADSLVRGLSPAQVAHLRQGAEYKRGYHMLASVLPELKGNDAVVACQAISGDRAKHGLELREHEDEHEHGRK
jgi:hypothetical protein